MSAPRLVLQSGCAHPSPRAHPAQGRRGLHRDRPARGLEDPGGRRRARCGASTIRNELAILEEQGLLAHPHTTAGRVPTDAGHRFYVDRLLGTGVNPRERTVELQLVRREVDEAMRTTTETLSQVTNLLAIVSAPPIDTATIRHVEVLLLQPQVLMVVVITSTGGVTKKVLPFERPVDQGLAAWAGPTSTSASRASASARARCTPAQRSVAGATERGFLERLRPPSPSWPTPPRTPSTSAARRGCCPSTASRTSPRSTS